MEPNNYFLPSNTFDTGLKAYQDALAGRKADAATKAAELTKFKTEQRSIFVQGELDKLGDKSDASAEDYARVIALDPKNLAEPLTKSWGILSPERKTQTLAKTAKLYSALNVGRTDFAVEMIESEIEAARNSGEEAEVKEMERLLRLVKVDPAAAKIMAGASLAASGDADKVAGVWKTMGEDEAKRNQAPAELAKTEAETGKLAAEAEKTGVESGFAKAKEESSIKRTNAEIANIQSQIVTRKEELGVRRSEVGLKAAENDLKLAELNTKLEDSRNAKKADIAGAHSNIDNMLNSLTRAIATPISDIDTATGFIQGRLPAMTQSAENFRELMKNVGAQAFLAQIPNMKGMGALSSAEGEKLQAALQSFSTTQDTKSLVANLKEARRLILKARAFVTQRYGAQETTPDVPAAKRGVKSYGSFAE